MKELRILHFKPTADRELVRITENGTAKFVIFEKTDSGEWAKVTSKKAISDFTIVDVSHVERWRIVDEDEKPEHYWAAVVKFANRQKFVFKESLLWYCPCLDQEGLEAGLTLQQFFKMYEEGL